MSNLTNGGARNSKTRQIASSSPTMVNIRTGNAASESSSVAEIEREKTLSRPILGGPSNHFPQHRHLSSINTREGDVWLDKTKDLSHLSFASASSSAARVIIRSELGGSASCIANSRYLARAKRDIGLHEGWSWCSRQGTYIKKPKSAGGCRLAPLAGCSSVNQCRQSRRTSRAKGSKSRRSCSQRAWQKGARTLPAFSKIPYEKTC